jgi:uncharacterized membrane-anchored protein
VSRTSWIAAIALGLAITALFWLDPIFIPLALLGPVVFGVLAARRRLPWLWVAVVWFVAGVGAVISDWVVNHEDVAFHIGLTAVMIVLASLAWWVTRAIGGRARENPAL